MFEQGADIVHQVAGGTGIGVIQPAKETGHFAIGVDANTAGKAAADAQNDRNYEEPWRRPKAL
jgi:basic membrane lipoprotein Med (substrate-binding protein (PBP1-ABC) superfamily)